MSNYTEKNVLLGILPYWDPLIPPSGIATLKGHLNAQGFNNIKTIDLIVEKKFQDLYNLYFSTLEKCVPKNSRGNFYNMGHNILQDHMMAHINKKDNRTYYDLIRLMVKEEFCQVIFS